MANALDVDTGPFEFPKFGELVVGILFGALFISFSFPLALEKLARATGWPLVGGAGEFAGREMDAAFGASSALQSVSFYTLWTLCLLGVGGYLIALLLLSLRHLRFDLLALGIVFLAIGTAILHIITWTIWLIGWALHFLLVAALFIVNILVAVVEWLFHLLATVISAILGFFGTVFGAILGFLIRSGLWPLALVILGGIALFLLIRYWKDLREFFATVGVIGLVLAVAAGVAFLLYKLFQIIWPFLKPIFEFLGRILGYIGRFLGVILGFIGRILVPVLIALLVGWIVYGLGAILMDTFRGAWHSGNGRRGVIICSLSIGTLLAIILMETNLYNIVSYYPSYFSVFALHYLHVGLPLVDVLVCLLVLVISIMGAFRNVPRMQAELDLKRFQTGFFMISLALVVGIAVVAVAAALNQGSS
jgi:hypothetical protein